MAARPLSRSKTLVAKLLHAALSAVRDAGGQLSLADIRAQVLEAVQLDDWAKEIIESNRLPRWEMYLQFFSIDAVKAGYLVKNRGIWSITEAGTAALKQTPDAFLSEANAKYRAWQKLQTPKSSDSTSAFTPSLVDETDADLPPEDSMGIILKEAHRRLAAEILESLRKGSPAFFERVVLETLLRMGYGGYRPDAGISTGQSGDEGIDGLINEDHLGLSTIYLQAKRWKEKNTVGRPEVQKFVGALVGQQANKGVFIAASSFTKDAEDYVKKIQQKVVLIDGEQLAQYMIKYSVGVSTAATYELKKIDSDYFAEE